MLRMWPKVHQKGGIPRLCETLELTQIELKNVRLTSAALYLYRVWYSCIFRDSTNKIRWQCGE